ncbi:NAD-dependent epimerase/dehydratase family protein [Flammeovirga aprica]|uniref:NAD(P)-dependent oxidoreductase n=1 Tax=Flammeovirga aprica JL-4 TaxID=694437 RepID=A0A7X9P249_9BACT|nr:NAD(P)-dependent oxidoreductase [Flammeovirga aprica]NME68169.1 NAD(P)-dependent oxidoreductase [Flammeovirga aprica JL-4]
MKIALIGGSSFLAEKILEQYALNDQDEITIYTRTKKAWMFYPFQEGDHLRKPKYRIKTFDAYEDQVHSWVYEWSRNDVIINTMAAGVQPKQEVSSQGILEINAFFAIKLIEGLLEHKFKGKLFTFGSYFEIGDTDSEELLSEQDFVFSNNKLPNTYCISKKTLTQFIHHKHQSSPFDFEHLHLILTNIYGKGENENRLFPYIVQSVKDKKDLKFSSGLQQRQFTHIADVAKLIIKLASSTSHYHGIYNITSDKTNSVKEVIVMMLQQLEEKGYVLPKYEFGEVNRRDQSMKFLGVSSKKAQNELNWDPEISIEEGLKEYYENN